MPFNYFPIISAVQKKENPLFVDPNEILKDTSQTNYKEDLAMIGQDELKEIGKTAKDNIADLTAFAAAEDINKMTEEGLLQEDIKGVEKQVLNDKIATAGDKIKGAAGGITQLGFQTFANFKNTAETSGERTAQTLQGAAQGASVGMALGGPVGAVAGGALMAGLNLIDNRNDKKEMVQKGIAENDKAFADKKKERALAYGQTQQATDNEQRMTGFSSNFKLT
jgi:hypothetical protein